MSAVTVLTRKLPFGIQSILGGEDEEDKCSESNRFNSKSNAMRKSCDKNCLAQQYYANSTTPYHFPCREMEMTAYEAATALPSTDTYRKLIHNLPLSSDSGVRDYCCCGRLAFSTQYPPIHYGFPSTSLAIPSQLGQFNEFPCAKFGNLSISPADQSFFSLTSRSADSKNVNLPNNQRTMTNDDPNHGQGGLHLATNPSRFQQLPIITAPLLPANSESSTKQPEEMSRRDRSAMARRIGHPYQSRAPARHKKPRTSFTKKQIASLETRFLAQKYLASAERVNLANELEMSDAQVKTWFQNRRTKWRRQEAEEKEYEDKANVRMMSSYSKCFFARPDIVL